MKRASICGLVCILLILYAPWPEGRSNSHGQVNTKGIFGQVHWTDEGFVYDLLSSVDIVGTVVFDIKPNAQREASAYTITQKMTAGPHLEVSKLMVKAAGLKPVQLEKMMTTPQGHLQINAEYTNGHVTIALKMNENSQTMTLAVPGDTYDNDQILMSLRALPFERGKEWEFNTFSAAVGRTFVSNIKIVGKEEIKTDAGTFQCYKLLMSAGGQKHFAWYDSAPPHCLVVYDNGKFTFRLKKVL